MYSFRKWKEKYGRVTLRSLWDLFMVWVVIINLCLILFDLTYLWLRTHLFPVSAARDPDLGPGARHRAPPPHRGTDRKSERSRETLRARP